MHQNTSPEIRSFRLTTRKKQSIKSFSQEKAQSNSSEQSSFSSEYNMLTKRLKIKAKNINSTKLGATVSSFGGLASFRVRTQSGCERMSIGKVEGTLRFFPRAEKSGKVQVGSGENFRYSTQVKDAGRLKFSTQNYKIKKNFKIQRPSIYWQMSQQSNELSLLNKNPQKSKNIQDLSLSQSQKPKQKLLENILLLWQIRQSLTPTQRTPSSKPKPKQIIKSIKSYIMRKQQKDDPNNSMQKIFTKEEEQSQFKEVLACERVILVGVVELVGRERLWGVCLECVAVLDSLIGFYRYLLGLLFKEAKFFQFGIGYTQSQKLCTEIDQAQIEQKTSLTSTLLYLYTKFQTVYRYSPILLKKVKGILANAKRVSINRSFYDLLTCFAVYLNQVQVSGQGSGQIFVNKYISSFVTCPSPFIVQPRKNRKYTLVLDLDETLVYTKFQTSSLSQPKTLYRPHLKPFLTNLHKHFQLIIFTSSISSYALETLSPFSSLISHILCRQHTIKNKGQTIKDLSRIGRPLQSTIIVDNLAGNFRLQRENGIVIRSWYGDCGDRELERLQGMLVRLVGGEPGDVRKELKMIAGTGGDESY